MSPRNPAASSLLVLGLVAGAALATGTFGCAGHVVDASRGPGDDVSDASPPDAAPGTDASPGRDAGPPINPPDAAAGPCPVSAPSIGTACSVENLQCEYGASEYPGCDVIMQCTSGSWQNQFGKGFCPGINPAGCPASAAAASGQSCEPGPNGTTSCYYPTGGCYCGSQFGPQPIYPDGGPPQQWQCDDPGAACPLPRPRIGSVCAQEGTTCEYLQCNFAQACTGGVWVDEPEGCAVAGGGTAGAPGQ
jgi:hypothetical protein